jgi:CDP-diacylglycerol--serine O-phosphatidyltransferase
MRKIRVTRSVIPNLLTLMNLFCGFIALTRLSVNDFFGAAEFVAAAALFDVLDGAVARLTKSTSDLGVELDSLCDAVSFGIVPSFMLYQLHFRYVPDWGTVISALPALAGVYRLARFNVQLTGFEDKKYFRGMPIPAGALVIFSYALFYFQHPLIPLSLQGTALAVVTIITALIMVSTIKYDALPTPTPHNIRQRPAMFAFGLFAFFATIFSKGVLLFPIMLGYILVGLIRLAIIAIQNRRTADDDEDDSIEEDEVTPFDL